MNAPKYPFANHQRDGCVHMQQPRGCGTYEPSILSKDVTRAIASGLRIAPRTMPWIGECSLRSGRGSNFLASAKFDQECFVYTGEEHRLCRNAGSGSSDATQANAVRWAYFLTALGKVTDRQQLTCQSQLEFGLLMVPLLRRSPLTWILGAQRMLSDWRE